MYLLSYLCFVSVATIAVSVFASDSEITATACTMTGQCTRYTRTELCSIGVQCALGLSGSHLQQGEAIGMVGERLIEVGDAERENKDRFLLSLAFATHRHPPANKAPSGIVT